MAKQDIPQIQTQPREKMGTRYSKRLREQGQLPAVVYGHKQETLHIAVNGKEFSDILHHGAHLLEVAINDKKESVLVKAVQWDYLGEHIVHVDFARVDLSEQVDVDLEIELLGEPKALQEEGAILSQPATTVTVSCRADSIPEKLTHNIESLELNGSISLGDLVLPEGVKLADSVEASDMVAQITIVQEEPEEQELEGEEGAEPEVIGASEESEEGEQKEEAAE